MTAHTELAEPDASSFAATASRLAWLSPARMGGVAGLLFVAAGLSLNFVVIAPAPAFNAPTGEIAAYISQEADSLVFSDSMRYLVALLVPLFAVGLYRVVSGPADGPHRAWAVLGIAGAVWISAVGTVANSVEVAGVWQIEGVVNEPELLRSIWGFGAALFIAASLAWGTMILGFSVAGYLTRVAPGWLTGLGLLAVAMCLVGGTGVRSVLDGGWAQYPWFASVLLFPLWVVSMSVVMLRRA